MSSKKGPRIQTKRNPTNKKNHDKGVNHWLRVLNKRLAYRWKTRGE